MLQQTQIRSVLDKKYFQNWINKFPTAVVLAQADEAEILKAWEGLGYYNRARNLQKAAQMVVEKFQGEFPKELKSILELPGVGPYTAGAVRSFSFNLNAAIVDGNVSRVLTRVFKYSEPIDSTLGQKQIWRWAEDLTDQERPRLYNSAIMELGQQICRKSSPNCSDCPVSEWCAVRGDHQAAESLPYKKKKTKLTTQQESVVCVIQNEKILLTRETGSRRGGLWRLPLLEGETERFHKLTKFSYAITRYKVELTVWAPSDDQMKACTQKIDGQWFDLAEELPAMGSPYRKAILRVLDQNLED